MITLRSQINEAVGMERSKIASTSVKRYPYVDPAGTLLFEKLRYEPKRFALCRPDDQGGTVWNLDGVSKVLYRLPEIITAAMVIVVEGEKSADYLRTAIAARQEKFPGQRIAVTTNFDGAGNWLPEYNPYFAGRLVAILPDNDSPGKKHGGVVADSVSRFAAAVQVVELPGLPEHGGADDS